MAHHVSGQLQKTLQPKKRRKKKLIQLSSRGDTNSEKAARVAAASVSQNRVMKSYCSSISSSPHHSNRSQR